MTPRMQNNARSNGVANRRYIETPEQRQMQGEATAATNRALSHGRNLLEQRQNKLPPASQEQAKPQEPQTPDFFGHTHNHSLRPNYVHKLRH